MNPSMAPVVVPIVDCVTYPPTRGIYYDCNADFIADSDCFDSFRYTCEACCYTDVDVFGTRPCWTPQHTKEDCCGVGTDVAPTNPPDIGPICGDQIPSASPSTTTTTTKDPSPDPTEDPSFKPSSSPSPTPITSNPTLSPFTSIPSLFPTALSQSPSQ